MIKADAVQRTLRLVTVLARNLGLTSNNVSVG